MKSPPLFSDLENQFLSNSQMKETTQNELQTLLKNNDKTTGCV